MAIFKIKETEKIMMAYIYEVEADTKEEALEKYINELAGSLTCENEFMTPEVEETVTAYSEEDCKS